MTVVFPPYGRMVAEWEADIANGGTAPTDWKGGDAAAWKLWRSKVLDLIAAILWPRFDYAARDWIGPARSTMEALTIADFQMLAPLRKRLSQPADVASGMTEMQLFVFEDTSTITMQFDGKAGVTLKTTEERSVERTLREHMAGVLDDDVLSGLVAGYRQGLGGKAGEVDLQLKQELQRPRAYQMSVIMGESWFTHQWATRAVTPSMISGHSFQGSMGGVAAYYALKNRTSNAKAMERLAQHTVGIGDRRVFAGVHYPSDNLSSWIVALLLAPLVCPDTDGRHMLWQAIDERSIVFGTIRQAVTDGRAPAHRPAFELVQLLGENLDMDIDKALAHVRGE